MFMSILILIGRFFVLGSQFHEVKRDLCNFTPETLNVVGL